MYTSLFTVLVADECPLKKITAFLLSFSTKWQKAGANCMSLFVNFVGLLVKYPIHQGTDFKETQ